MASEPNNPYESPMSMELHGPGARSGPGPLAMFGIVVLSIIAAACTFFGTCFGIGMGLYSSGFNADEHYYVFAFGGGTVVGVFVGWAIYRVLTGKRIFRRQSSVETPHHDDVS
jgi:hypothetical protein